MTPDTPPPDWLTSAQAALDRLDGPHADKKRATIIALVDAHLAGKPEATVWEPRRPETCSKTTYDIKWKKESIFAEVLAEVDKIAKGYHTGEELRALLLARRRLALASPVAVEQLINMATAGRVRRADVSEDGRLRTYFVPVAGPEILRAVLGILDRGGVETAQKGSSEQSGAVQLVVEYVNRRQD